MQHKTYPVQVKATSQDGLDEGQFEALVAVFGNKDLHGDVIRKGAFTDTLKAWSDSGDPIPIYWSHRMDDPDYNIGHVLDAKEVDEGLWVKGQLDTDPAAAKSAQVNRLLKGRRVTQFSFAYDIDEGGFETADGDDFFELRKLSLYEVGPTPIGANPRTELLAAKSAKSAIPVGAGPKDTSEGDWDGPANKKRLPDGDGAAETLRKAFAWVDPDGDPDAKSSYTMIHHEVGEDGTVGAANIKACQNGIAILNGGRGGADIPDADRKGVYTHLAAHLKAADVEPPELKSTHDVFRAIAREEAAAAMAAVQDQDDPHAETPAAAEDHTGDKAAQPTPTEPGDYLATLFARF